VKADVARGAAHRLHGRQLGRSGEPLIEHVERVARAVPREARALAYLHDVLEHAGGAGEELHELGLSEDDVAVLVLLTRARSESYRVYVMRIVRADGRAGRIARMIKLADLDDHLRHRRSRGGAPNYAWARAQIAAAQSANGEAPSAEDASRKVRRSRPPATAAGALRGAG
jgi:hypothetical protein